MDVNDLTVIFNELGIEDFLYIPSKDNSYNIFINKNEFSKELCAKFEIKIKNFDVQATFPTSNDEHSIAVVLGSDVINRVTQKDYKTYVRFAEIKNK